VGVGDDLLGPLLGVTYQTPRLGLSRGPALLVGAPFFRPAHPESDLEVLVRGDACRGRLGIEALPGGDGLAVQPIDLGVGVGQQLGRIGTRLVDDLGGRGLRGCQRLVRLTLPLGGGLRRALQILLRLAPHPLRVLIGLSPRLERVGIAQRANPHRVRVSGLADLARLGMGVLYQRPQPGVHRLRRDRRGGFGELAAGGLDLGVRVGQLGGQIGAAGEGRVPFGGQRLDLGVGARHVILDLISVVAAHGDLEGPVRSLQDGEQLRRVVLAHM
jgi:hypothetical protein